MNQLQAVALNEGLRCKKRLCREAGREQLEAFCLAPWASQRRRDLLELLDRLDPTIAKLTQAIEQEVEKCPEARRLRTHPGVGSLTALAFVLIIGRADRFQCGKQIASYLGLVPLEESSGDRRRLGHITKQGNSLLRFLLVDVGLRQVQAGRLHEVASLARTEAWCHAAQVKRRVLGLFGVIGANMGCKLFVALRLELAHHFIEGVAGRRSRSFEPPVTFGTPKTPKTLPLNPHQLPAHRDNFYRRRFKSVCRASYERGSFGKTF